MFWLLKMVKKINTHIFQSIVLTVKKFTETFMKVILLMIMDDEKWIYAAVKNLSVLLRRITSKHDGGCYCINCSHFFKQKMKLKRTRKSVKIMTIVI